MNQPHQAELTNLFHRAQTALDHPSRYERMRWAAHEFNKLHPETTRTIAYIEIDIATR